MNTFKNQARQGDIFIKRIDRLPDGLRAAKKTPEGYWYVAHSESGHHHVMEGACEVFESDDPTTLYLRVIEESEVVLRHLKIGEYAHRALQFTKGLFRLRIGREHTPDGWRKVTD